MVHIPHLPFSCLCSPSFWCLVPGPRNRRPFSLTYGANLPSSLTMLLPIVLGFSPHLPVSVCGTGTFYLDSGFSRQCGIICFGTCFPSPSRLRIAARTSLRSCLPRLDERFQQFAQTILLFPHFSHNDKGWYRNINLLSIDYASRPRLRSRLTLGGRPFPRKP